MLPHRSTSRRAGSSTRAAERALDGRGGGPRHCTDVRLWDRHPPWAHPGFYVIWGSLARSDRSRCSLDCSMARHHPSGSGSDCACSGAVPSPLTGCSFAGCGSIWTPGHPGSHGSGAGSGPSPELDRYSRRGPCPLCARAHLRRRRHPECRDPDRRHRGPSVSSYLSDDFLYDFKGGSLRSPPARPGYGRSRARVLARRPGAPAPTA